MAVSRFLRGAACAVVIALASGCYGSATVTLRDGRKFEGRILGRDEAGLVWIESRGGQVGAVKRKDVVDVWHPGTGEMLAGGIQTRSSRGSGGGCCGSKPSSCFASRRSRSRGCARRSGAAHALAGGLELALGPISTYVCISPLPFTRSSRAARLQAARARRYATLPGRSRISRSRMSIAAV